MNLTSTYVVRIFANDTNATIAHKLTGQPLATVSPGRQLTIGFFVHDDGVHGAMAIANYDFAFADRPRVTFDAMLGVAGEHVMEVDQNTGRWVPLRKDDDGTGARVDPALTGVAINLPAGGGRLLVYNAGSQTGREAGNMKTDDNDMLGDSC
jgi:hypothetical protein